MFFNKKITTNATVIKIEDADNFNPAQFQPKNGYPVAGSSGRFHVTFQLEDETLQIFNVSSKQAGTLSNGMKGKLIYSGNVFQKFVV